MSEVVAEANLATDEANACRLRLTIDGGLHWHHQLHLSFASHIRWGCSVPITTSAHRLRLRFDGGVLWQPPPLPVVRASDSMGVWCANHHLRPSSTSRVRWGCTLAATTSVRCPHLGFDGSVVCQPLPSHVACMSCSMGVSFGSHHLRPLYTSRG